MASPVDSVADRVGGLLVAQAPAPSGAAGGPDEGRPSFAAEQAATALSNELMSPYCPGRTLSACPSEAARKVERWMASEFDAGRTKTEIKAELQSRFGDKVGTQLDGTVLAVSGALAVFGLLVVVALGRSWRSAAPSSAAARASAVELGRAGRPAPHEPPHEPLPTPSPGVASLVGARAAAGIDGASADELEDLEAELDRIDRL